MALSGLWLLKFNYLLQMLCNIGYVGSGWGVNKKGGGIMQLGIVAKFILATAAAIGLLGTEIPGVAFASISSPIQIDFVNGIFTDSSGVGLKVLSSSGDSAERTNFAETQDGISVKTVETAALPTHLTADSLGQLEPTNTEFTTDDKEVEVSGTTALDGLDQAQLQRQFMYAITPSTISMAWKPVDEATSYVVSIDENQRASGSSTQFSFSGFEPGENRQFTILALDENGDTLLTRAFTIEFLSSYRPSRTRTYQQWNSSLLYRTFIPMANVGPLDLGTAVGCAQFSGNRTFGGDNRSWVYPPFNTPNDATTYRTSVLVNVNWDNPQPWDVVWVKKVRPTRLYENGVLIDTRTASADGIQITDTYASGSYAQARITHAVGNPYCSHGAITYDVMVRFYRSGMFEVVGYRYPVPNHEIYGAWDAGGYPAWYALALMPHTAFICLLGVCGTETINVNQTH